MNALTARYSGSSETVMEADLNRLRDLTAIGEFASLVNQQVDDTLTEDYWNITLPNDLATAGARSPYLFAYQAALNLLNARALFSQDSVAALLAPGVHGVKAGLERHHLFPKAYLRTLEIDAAIDVNQIANLAIVGWEVNGQISDEAPSEYWPVWVQKFGKGPEDLSDMQFWHALPDAWQEMDYHQFLATRRQLMAKVIRAGFGRLSGASSVPPPSA
jgi:hypothetical protein